MPLRPVDSMSITDWRPPCHHGPSAGIAEAMRLVRSVVRVLALDCDVSLCERSERSADRQPEPAGLVAVRLRVLDRHAHAEHDCLCTRFLRIRGYPRLCRQWAMRSSSLRLRLSSVAPRFHCQRASPERRRLTEYLAGRPIQRAALGTRRLTGSNHDPLPVSPVIPRNRRTIGGTAEAPNPLQTQGTRRLVLMPVLGLRSERSQVQILPGALRKVLLARRFRTSGSHQPMNARQ